MSKGKGVAAFAHQVARVSKDPSKAMLLSVDRNPLRADWQRGILFPNAIFTMINNSKEAPANQVNFRVPLNFNKFQIKNYLEEIYGVKVSKVHTAIYLGQRKRTPWHSKFKLKDWKKAMVTIDTDFKYPTLEESKDM